MVRRFAVAGEHEMCFSLHMNGLDEQTFEPPRRESDAGLHTTVAVIVALAATFTAVCNVKDGNIVQAMSQAQSNGVDAWSYYQAKSTKQNIAEATVDQIIVQRDATPNLLPETRATFERKIAEHTAKAKQYESEKNEIKKAAEGYQKEYDRLNYRDDQFDAAEACLTLCMALLGVTALTQKRWLLVVGVFFAVIGVMLGLGGFLGYKFHPAMLAKILG
jgi:hypothetical protein